MLQATKAHIALITETKLPEKQKKNIKGYKWIGKNRKNRTGGGVGILVAQDISKHAIEDNINDDVEGVETQWIQLECRPRNISIGVFYGPQENEKIEKVKEIYETLDHQINQRKKTTEVILGGDFNAKIKMDQINQNESRNGKILEDIINKNDLTTATTNANRGHWTRQEWNNPEKRSVVDYILTTKCITNNITAMVIDEEEAFKIKTKDETPTDHNTIIMNIKINNPRRKTFTERWKTNNKEGWEKFNTELQRANQTNQLAK